MHVYSGLNADTGEEYTGGDLVQVKIRGTFPKLYCNGLTNCAALRSVEQWGDITWATMNAAFKGAANLTINATDTPNLVNVVDMTSMFYNATNLTGNFSGWDTSRVTNMSQMFYGASSFNQDVSSWNVGNVADMSYMFQNATNFNQPLS
jgi:surface protein